MIGYHGATVGDFARYFNGAVIWRAAVHDRDDDPHYVPHMLFMSMHITEELSIALAEHEYYTARPLLSDEDPGHLVSGAELTSPGPWIIYRVPLGYASSPDFTKLVRLVHNSSRGIFKGLSIGAISFLSIGIKSQLSSNVEVNCALGWFGRTLARSGQWTAEPLVSPMRARELRRLQLIKLMQCDMINTHMGVALSDKIAVLRAGTNNKSVCKVLHNGLHVGTVHQDPRVGLVFTIPRSKLVSTYTEKVALMRLMEVCFADVVDGLDVFDDEVNDEDEEEQHDE